jgi:hypothetical protein
MRLSCVKGWRIVKQSPERTIRFYGEKGRELIAYTGHVSKLLDNRLWR